MNFFFFTLFAVKMSWTKYNGGGKNDAVKLHGRELLLRSTEESKAAFAHFDTPSSHLLSKSPPKLTNVDRMITDVIW